MNEEIDKQMMVSPRPSAACVCGRDEWIVFPLYRRCQHCGAVQKSPDGWRWLIALQEDVHKAKSPND